MYDTYIIETRKGAAGIVVRDGRGFRFFAATHDFNGLEGQVFGTPKRPKPRRCGMSTAPARGRRHPGSRTLRCSGRVERGGANRHRVDRHRRIASA
jgi:hypothetical protein